MRDYYDVLGLQSNATDEEIKTAYRKAALKWHPDRNFGNTENATKEFADAQSAYEILSDVNERAWYDRHKDSILRGDTSTDDSPQNDDVSGLSIPQLMAHFSKVNSAPLDDTSKGFFTIARKLFDTIIDEELEACLQQDIDPPRFPTFGGSQSDDYDVRNFYSNWSTFNSNKTFSWAEQYAYHRAPDRRVRRVMEKENAKCRQAERKEYNEVIHKLVSYMKKRDYRFVAKPQISAARRQQELLEARQAQAEASRAANKANMADYEEQDWQKVDDRTLAEEEMQAFDEWETEIECVACGKTFKSEKQYSTHERSKKHIQTVKRLRWEMKKEAMALGLDYDSDDSFATADEGSVAGSNEQASTPSLSQAEDDVVPASETGELDAATTPAEVSSRKEHIPIASDDEYAPRADFEARLEADLDTLKDLDLDLGASSDDLADVKSQKPMKKKKKAKARKKNRG